MAKFGINDILNAKSKAGASAKTEQYTEIYLSPYDVKPSENNFYSQENIEELADSFLAVGQQQPTVLGRVNGEFRIVSGHRRNLANIKNIERGHNEYKRIRYLYKDMTEAMYDLSLLIGNVYNRELTPWEKTQQAQKLKEALLRAKEEDGLEIIGKLREVIAELLNESSTNVARMDSINNHATPEIKEEFAKGNIGISAAYEAAKLPEEEQKEIAGKAAAGEEIRAKEIAKKVAEKTEWKRYCEEQDKIDRETRKKLQEQEDREKMEVLPSEWKQGPEEYEMRIASSCFPDIEEQKRRFELLKKDKDYKIGDRLKLMEYKGGKATGKVLNVEITCILEDYTGLEDGYCIIGFKPETYIEGSAGTEKVSESDTGAAGGQ